MLQEAFESYCRQVQVTESTATAMREEERPVLYIDPAMRAKSLVEDWEKTAAFEELVSATRHEFEARRAMGKKRHSDSPTSWSSAVGHFFRRSGYYLDVLDGKSTDSEMLLRLYADAWTRETCSVTYLAPIEYVYFQKNSFDFGSFSIVRHSASDLDQLLSNRSNQAFYRWAAVDTELLSDYWLLTSSRDEPVRGIGLLSFDLSRLHQVELRYTKFPAPIESALDTLCLFERQADAFRPMRGRDGSVGEKGFMGWQGPNLPFVLRLTDNLLEAPTTSPPTSVLCQEDFFDHTGEYIGERPCIHTHFSEEEAAAFEQYISKVKRLIDLVGPREDCWPFLRVAFGNLRKAFFAEGLEQLLWHITALEALLGEKGEGVTERLARRVSLILGATERQRKDIRRQFKALYAFRSNLVHGNTFEDETHRSHLHAAREFARKSMFWFLNYLACVAEDGDDCAALPAREDLLRVVELSAESRVRLGSMLAKVPAGFPYIAQWDAETDAPSP